MAEGKIKADRCASWAADPSANRECQVEWRPTTLYAACGCGPRAPLRSVDAERFLAQMKGIADTGFVVAFASREDRHHEWAVDVAKGITEPLLTCEAVLAESAFHLRSVARVLSLVDDDMLLLAFDCNRNLDRLAELADRYQDREPDFADLCLIRMSELFPRHTVITTDENDFRVYRRNKREPITLLCPPRAS